MACLTIVGFLQRHRSVRGRDPKVSPVAKVVIQLFPVSSPGFGQFFQAVARMSPSRPREVVLAV